MLIRVVRSGMTSNERLSKKRWCTSIVKREGWYDSKGREKEDGEWRLNDFKGERLPCVCGYYGRGSHICGLADPYQMISDFIRCSDWTLRLACTVHID